MPTSPAKPDLLTFADECIATLTTQLLSGSSKLAATPPDASQLLADLLGTCPAHVLEWTHAALSLSGSRAYCTAWQLAAMASLAAITDPSNPSWPQYEHDVDASPWSNFSWQTP